MAPRSEVEGRLGRLRGANSQAFFNTLGLVVLYGVNFFTLPLFSRLLGSAGFGMFSLFTSWAQIGTVVVGLQVALTIPMAAVHLGEERLERYTAAVLTLMTLLTLVLLPLFVVYGSPLSRWMGMPGIPAVMVLGQAYFAAIVGVVSQLFINRLQALQNFFISAGLSIGSVVLSGALMLGPLRDHPALGRIVGALVAYVVAGGVLGVLVYAKGRILIDRAAWSYCLPISLPLVLHGLSAVVLAQIAKVLLQRLSGSMDLVGYYGMAITCASLLQALLQALNNTWVPVFYRTLAGGESSPDEGAAIAESTLLEAEPPARIGALSLSSEALPAPGAGSSDVAVRAKNYIFLFTSLACGLVLLAPEVIRIFAGRGFEQAVLIMPFLVGAVVFTFHYLLPVNYELFRKDSRYVSLGTVGAAVASIAIGWPLIRFGGLMGAAVSNLLAYALLFAFHSAICHYRMPGYPFSWRMSVGPILVYAVAAAAMYIALPWWYVRWLLALVVAGLLIRHLMRTRSVF